jgi:predicted RNA binding protein YcfA (HicA-like mRNA interferase family)
MPKITPVKWQKFEKFLIYLGCTFEREKGDHRIWWRSDLSRPVVLQKVKDLPVFIIRNNLRVLGVSQDEYLKILGQL